MLEDYIQGYVARNGFQAYTELRAQRNTTKSVGLLKGDMIRNAAAAIGGVSARVRKNGSVGFASGNDYSAEGISAIVGAARDNASFLAEKTGSGKKDFAPVTPVRMVTGFDAEEAVSRQFLTDFAVKLDEYVAAKYPKLASRYVGCSVLNMEKLLYTSDGVVSHSFVPRATVYAQMTVSDKEGTPIDLFDAFGDYGPFTKVFSTPEELYQKIDELYEKVMLKSEGVYPEPGYKQVIMHPDLAGMLAHEAVGHTVEADFVLSGSVAGPNLGKQVASELVNLTDFANTAFGSRLAVPVFVDDEGTPAVDVPIIQNGILTGYMHSKESAETFGVAPTGNARAYSFGDEPLIRMRNTCILPGKDKLADMIAATEDGYYLVSTGNGQADATGEFMFGVDFGYEIKHGKLGRPLKSTTISGVAFDMLKTVDMLSDDLSWVCVGMCGKKQAIPVSMGGPAIRCMVNVGGR